ncbi:hypothetical protein JAO77_00100 [Hymenobacter sp. BT559]|nr:hypothetical protein [Hymenobacter sp. BT559]
MEDVQKRQRVVQGALAMTADTALAPDCYERQLLEEYVKGLLSIDEVLLLLAQQQPAEE